MSTTGRLSHMKYYLSSIGRTAGRLSAVPMVAYCSPILSTAGRLYKVPLAASHLHKDPAKVVYISMQYTYCFESIWRTTGRLYEVPLGAYVKQHL